MYQGFLIVHLVCIVLLAGLSFVALAAPTHERRRSALMQSGTLALVVFITGFGLLGVQRLPMMQGWVLVKLLCWLALAMIPPMAFRMRKQASALTGAAIGAIVIAVTMVVLKPF